MPMKGFCQQSLPSLKLPKWTNDHRNIQAPQTWSIQPTLKHILHCVHFYPHNKSPKKSTVFIWNLWYFLQDNDLINKNNNHLDSTNSNLFFYIYLFYKNECTDVCLSVDMWRANGNPKPCTNLDKILHLI